MAIEASEMRNLLEESIQHWERLITGEDKELGPEACALCREFIGRGCKGCVVFDANPLSEEEAIIFSGCQDTPYPKVYYHIIACPYCIEGTRCNVFKALAQTELDFLKSLRERADEYI